jgi:hypothetical protein
MHDTDAERIEAAQDEIEWQLGFDCIRCGVEGLVLHGMNLPSARGQMLPFRLGVHACESSPYSSIGFIGWLVGQGCCAGSRANFLFVK